LVVDTAYIGFLEADTAYIGFLEGLNPDRVVTVAKSGGDYTTITTGITTAASERTAGEIWTVLVYPGEYDEAITLSDSIDIVAFNPENTTILQQVTDNNVECHCYLNITINSSQGDGYMGLMVHHDSSVIEVKGNITGGDGTDVGGYGVWNNSTGTIKVIGDITAGDGTEIGGTGVYNSSTGTVIIIGDITGGDGPAEGYGVYNQFTGTVTVRNGTIKSSINSSGSHSILNNGTLTLQDVKILCTHADAKSIYSSSAQDVSCMNVWANRDLHSNITNIITGGFTYDTDVQWTQGEDPPPDYSKIIVSDVDAGHGNSMKTIIEGIFNTATVTVRIESFLSSVLYAKDNDYGIISRSTTGLDDYRISNAGDQAENAEIIPVHGFGDADTGEDIEFFDPSSIGSIWSICVPNSDYGAGLEFLVNVGTASEAIATMSAYVGKFMTDYDVTISALRTILRNTASNNGVWNKNTGYGTVDFAAAEAEL